MSHNRTARSVSTIFVLLMCATLPAVAQQYVIPPLQQLKNYRPGHLTPAIRQSLTAEFAKSCLKRAMVCDHITIEFTSKDSGHEHVVSYVTLSGKSDVVDWNKYRTALIKGHHRWAKTLHFSASIRVRGKSTWQPITTSAECPYCVPPDSLKFGGGRQYQVKFDGLYQDNPHPEHSFWGLALLMARHNPRQFEPQRFLVEVESKHGPVVYASIRTAGSHYLRSTAATGRFIVSLYGDEVQNYRPAYAVFSLLPSWAAYGKLFTAAGRLASAGSEKLPEFHGSTQQILGAAVNYVKSLHIKYNTFYAGDLPRETVSEILSTRAADCVGFVTLLHALLRKAGVKSDPVLLNPDGTPPLSFSVPGPRFTRHAILYIPALDKFVDATFAASRNSEFRLPFSHTKVTWKNLARVIYPGYVTFNTVTNSFMAVH